MTRLVQHIVFCNGPDCRAQIKLEILGTHELRSVSQEIEDVAVRAGWVSNVIAGHACPEHAPPGSRTEAQRRERIEREVRAEVERRMRP